MADQRDEEFWKSLGVDFTPTPAQDFRTHPEYLAVHEPAKDIKGMLAVTRDMIQDHANGELLMDASTDAHIRNIDHHIARLNAVSSKHSIASEFPEDLGLQHLSEMREKLAGLTAEAYAVQAEAQQHLLDLRRGEPTSHPTTGLFKDSEVINVGVNGEAIDHAVHAPITAARTSHVADFNAGNAASPHHLDLSAVSAGEPAIVAEAADRVAPAVIAAPKVGGIRGFLNRRGQDKINRATAEALEKIERSGHDIASIGAAFAAPVDDFAKEHGSALEAHLEAHNNHGQKLVELRDGYNKAIESGVGVREARKKLTNALGHTENILGSGEADLQKAMGYLGSKDRSPEALSVFKPSKTNPVLPEVVEVTAAKPAGTSLLNIVTGGLLGKTPEQKADAAQRAAAKKVEDATKAVMKSTDKAAELVESTIGRLEGIAGGAAHTAAMNTSWENLVIAENSYHKAVKAGDPHKIKLAEGGIDEALGNAKKAVKAAESHIGEVNKVNARYESALASTNLEFIKSQEVKVVKGGMSMPTWGGVKDKLIDAKDWAMDTKAVKWTKTAGKWAGIATVGALAVGLLAGRREAQARQSAEELQAQNNEALAGQMAAMQGPQVGANTLMGLEPTPGAMAARVRGAAEQGPLNPPVDRQYQVIS